MNETPANEASRLAYLRSLQVLDTAPEALFDACVRVAASHCDTPVAAMSLVDEDRQWFKSAQGVGVPSQTPREVAFCARTIMGMELMEVPDALADERFAANPFVVGEPGIRFYAGVPIVPDGRHAVGALCVIDHRPRRLSAVQRESLRDLARMLGEALCMRASAAALDEARQMQRQAQSQADELAQLLQERTEMLDVLAHEVRQPLNNASAALQSAARALVADGPSAAAQRLERAQAVMGRVLACVDNTLAVSALLAYDQVVARQPTDLGMLVSLAIADMAVADRSRVQVNLQAGLADVDVGLLRLALRNLLSNALKFSPPGTEVCVRISEQSDEQGGEISIDVIDAGPGIEPEVERRLFQRGGRGRRSTGQASHGLGLYIVHRTMTLHGGSVCLVRNTAQGATFRLSLPVSLVE